MNAETVVFHHIPKTAGTTLNDILLRQYATGTMFYLHGDKKECIRKFKELSVKDKMKYRLIYGHQTIGVIDELDCPQVLTVFRDPIDRVVSLYYFARRNKEHVMHKLTNEHSLERFFGDGIHKEWAECNNGQFNSIKGLLRSKHFDVGDGTELDRLKRILEKRVIFGILEKFDESILLFQERLKWTHALYYLKKNVTDRTREYPGVVTQSITACNALDMDLYEFAKNQFEKQIESQDKASLLRFRLFNRYLGPFFSVKSRMRYFLIKRKLRDI